MMIGHTYESGILDHKLFEQARASPTVTQTWRTQVVSCLSYSNSDDIPMHANDTHSAFLLTHTCLTMHCSAFP